jgi:hypothetical protein
MVTIEVRQEDLVVHILGWDKLRAMRGSVTVPLRHIVAVRPRPPEAYFDDVIVESGRGVGTYSPGHFAAGTVQLADGRAFFDVHDPEHAIAIDLEGEAIQHIVVEVDGETPEMATERIAQALQARRNPSVVPAT